METNRSTRLFNARLSEAAERFEEMKEEMRQVASLPQELSVEERSLLALAYKSVVSMKRTSWRVLSSIEQQGLEEKKGLIVSYRKDIEREIFSIASELIGLVEMTLLPSVTSDEGRLFYYKLTGDYHRYLAEFQEGEVRKASADASRTAYEAASSAATSLSATHPLRLGLALNFSVFYFEVLESPDRACHLAKTAFDEAIAEASSLSVFL